MGKRMRRGGGGGGGRRSPATSGLRLSGELRRRIAAAGLEGAAADVAADQLRSQYPEYGRIKLQPFFACVREALDSLSVAAAAADDDSTGDEDDDGRGGGGGGGESPGPSSRKRPSRSDSSEQRLLRAEAEHLRRRRQIERPDPSDDSTSTSDDSVYEDRVDPVFDITKSMLRNSYSKNKPPIKPSKKQKDEEGEEDNMEIEVASEKPRRMATADGSGTETPVAEKSRRGGGEGENGWPRFRDLGGMKSVIEELMMEVIVPLCHPQLPRWLGVRPMAGILLHGPPGCGKTTLAHAIANETGVPFYKISAPEVVSGVSGNRLNMSGYYVGKLVPDSFG